MDEQRFEIPMQQPERLGGKAWNQESVKWVEENGRLVSAFQERCTDALERQAAALLNLLLAGAGGALAYAVSLMEQQAPAWMPAGMASASAWLFMVSALLVYRVLWSRPVVGPGNDPANLEAALTMATDQARVYHLQNHQRAIVADRARNDSVGRWLNICRAMAAVGTPIWFAVAAWAAY